MKKKGKGKKKKNAFANLGHEDEKNMYAVSCKTFEAKLSKWMIARGNRGLTLTRYYYA